MARPLSPLSTFRHGNSWWTWVPVTDRSGQFYAYQHWNTVIPCVSTGKTHNALHDFYGIPQELYRLEYPAKGSPDIAGQVVDHIRNAGLACDVDPTRGLDHGAWVPLRLMFPEAEVCPALYPAEP